MNGRIRVVAIAGLLALAACGGSSSPTGSGAIDGKELAASFVEILGDPALHANVVLQSTATADQGGDTLDFRDTLNGILALPDIDLEVAIEAEGEVTRFRVVIVGARSFVDLGQGWVEAPPGTVDATELRQAFVVVTDPDDLEYVGPAEVDGRTLYHLVTTGPLPYSPSGFEGGGQGTMDDMDAYVEADGTPVRIALSYTATGTANGAALSILGTTEMGFTDVGGDQVIVAPTLAPSTAPSPGSSTAPSSPPSTTP